MVWVQQYDNGIRIDVADPDNLGPFVGEGDSKASLRAIASLLDEGYAQLNAGGAAFPFRLGSGFAGYNTPETFADKSRAITARVHLYDGNWDSALTALGNSFYDLNGNLNKGVFHTFFHRRRRCAQSSVVSIGRYG